MKKRFIYILTFFLLFLIPFFSFADTLGEQTEFIVEKNYSESGAQKVKASLVEVGTGLYFYVEDNYWNSVSQDEKDKIMKSFSSLDSEFINNIKPKLNKVFGTESFPGIDNDPKMTILFYPLKGNARGYIRNIDSYSKANNPASNEREIVYLNILYSQNPYLKEFLTHEYMHLISINQKEKKLGGKSEEIWLNEALSEYAVTVAGYNDKDNSYLDNRINTFINNPSDSLIDWNNQVADYGSVTIFTHYLVEKYGIKVLADTLKSSKIGIDAINESLKSNGIDKTIQEIFDDFTVAVYLNDCFVSEKYCFKNEKLSKLHVLTLNNFLPISGDSNIFLGQTMSPFSVQYQKFIGGNGDLKFKFKGTPSGFFSLYYIIKKINGEVTVNSLKMPISNQEGELVVKDMDKDIASIVFIPSVKTFYNTSQNVKFYYSLSATNFISSSVTTQVPITITKPLSQMTRQELVNTILKLLIYVLSQQSKYSISNVIY
jgi:hypothetical protein